jgi:NCAIR mutase (PurE)-related protein
VDRDELRKLLGQVRAGKLSVGRAMDRMRLLPFEELGFATIDHHRAVRRGFPEVVYGPGKTPEQIVEIVRRIKSAGQTVLVTRVEPDVADEVRQAEPTLEHQTVARALVWRPPGRRRAGRSGILVLTAGTSDLPVAEEAALTAELMGNRVTRIFDVGVAGVHRLLAHREALTMARVIIVIAGMEGALPSVVGGMTDCPVIGVPTSLGYGAGGGGHAALLAMLNSCASGLTVVNIDNGFGAGYAAAMINRPRKPVTREKQSK